MRQKRRTAELTDKLTASSARGQLIGGGCFAIALTGSAHAPPIKAIEPSAILSFGVSKLSQNLRVSRLIRRR